MEANMLIAVFGNFDCVMTKDQGANLLKRPDLLLQYFQIKQ